MTSVRGALAGVIVPAVMAAACGGAVVPIDQYAKAAVQANCALLVHCGAIPDGAACEATTVVDVAQLVADVKMGWVRYDGAAAADCLNLASTGSCDLTDRMTAAEPRACRDTFKGMVPAGGDC